MKLRDILSEDYSHWRSGQNLNHTASGGNIKSSGIWKGLRPDNSYQHKGSFDLLSTIMQTKDEGLPASELSYSDNNKAKNLVQSEVLELHDGRYYVTPVGKKWFESFEKEYQMQWMKSHIPAYSGGITGVGK